jgi:hypothetical protein
MRVIGSIISVRDAGGRGRERMEQDKLFKPSDMSDLPRLNKCFLCGARALESNLRSISVPDQSGYIPKLACSKCLGAILSKEGWKNEGAESI